MRNAFYIILVFSLPLILCGCIWSGEHPYFARTVSINFPKPEPPSAATLTVTDTDVKSAVIIIENILTTNGFEYEPRPDLKNVNGFVAAYVKLETPTLRSGTLPEIYFQNNRLSLIIAELGNRSDRPSEITVHVSELVRSSLGARFGENRVKVKDYP